MPAFEDLQAKKAELIRKMTVASMFVAPSTAGLVTALTAGGVKEVQTVTITGGPTSGTFTLSFGSETTAAIAYNATAGAVQSALEALSGIGVGGVTGGGGPLPGTAVTVTFNIAGDVVQMTATSSLSGGTAPAVAVSTTTAGTAIEPVALPSGYVDVGLVTKDDGYSLGNEWEMSETTSHGVADATRRDILRNTSTVGFTAQETKRRVLEMFHAVDLSGVTPASPSGEIRFNKPLNPVTRYYRTLLLARDGIGTGAIYMGVFYPLALVSETGEQTGSEESEFGYPMTLTATPDTTPGVGYAVSYMFGGPGWRRLLVSMGFPAV